jgi:hypothetical protein
MAVLQGPSSPAPPIQAARLARSTPQPSLKGFFAPFGPVLAQVAESGAAA